MKVRGRTTEAVLSDIAELVRKRKELEAKKQEIVKQRQKIQAEIRRARGALSYRKKTRPSVTKTYSYKIFNKPKTELTDAELREYNKLKKRESRARTGKN